ncbi:hypothetical protein ONS96_009479 [Cadophora gregata f. sp. sojae]|nr:hypothetical protein ONS96_009479 [Cadophora gregata f. sp. sojae]
MSPNPRSGLGIRKSNTEYIDRDVDTWTHTSGDGSISSPTNLSTSTEPRHTSESNPSLELRSEKYSASEARDAESRNGIEERDGTRYITLTVTRSSGTYVTLVELGDTTLPTSYQVTQSQTTTSRIPDPGIPTGTIVGIVVGISLGVLALVGVFYVYLLRARHLKRIRRRRKRARRASASSGGPAPAAPPPAAGDAPPPPANP